MNDCIFCKIINNEIAAAKIGESGQVLAFNDNRPSADTHVLIVPKQHLKSFIDIKEDSIWLEMLQLSQKLIQELDLTSGYRLVFNGGRYQHVAHLHWHLLGGELNSPN